jgi:hypothetical protein
LPLSVLGPRECFALRRLASSWASDGFDMCWSSRLLSTR